MDNFVFNLPTRIIFGKGEFGKFGIEAKKIGKKALLVTGKRYAKSSGILETSLKMLKENGIDVVIFSEIEPNPEDKTINKGGIIAREEKVDLIIAVGGGSVLDAAKAISLVAKTGTPIWEYCERPPKAKMPEQIIPILAAVTVAATGSEADGNSVVVNSETREKRGIFGLALFPKVSIVDPLLTLSIPKEQTINGVIDIFVHILESYLTSRSYAPVSDRISEAMMKETIKQGEIVYNDLKNIDARESLSWLSTLALSGFPNAGRNGPFPVHRLGHPISGIYGIAHGRTLACILPSYLLVCRGVLEERLSLLGKALFSTQSPLKTIERLVHWLKNIDAFHSLKEYGIKKEDIKNFVEMAISDDGGQDSIKGREPIKQETMKQIYETAYNYKDIFRKV